MVLLPYLVYFSLRRKEKVGKKEQEEKELKRRQRRLTNKISEFAKENPDFSSFERTDGTFMKPVGKYTISSNGKTICFQEKENGHFVTSDGNIITPGNIHEYPWLSEKIDLNGK